MEFDFSKEQVELYQSVVAFCEEHLQYDVVALDAEGTFSREAWRSCADFGVLGWPVSTELGGAEYDVTTVAYLMEAFGYGCEDNSLAFAIGTQLWSIQTSILHFGSDEQIEKYIPGSISGDLIGAYAMTEEGSGSDALGLSATAVRDGDDYVINAEKRLITFAPIADFAIVFAKTDPDAGNWGVSAFLIDADTSGYHALPVEQKMGLRTVPIGRISLRDCRVPAKALLGKPGSGTGIFNYSQGWERGLVLAPHIGAMQRLLDRCVDIARNRKRAGVPIGKHQAVSHRIANMKLRLETARLLQYKTAWLQQLGKSNLMEAALTKMHLSECLTQSSLEALTIHGGEGYLSEFGVERNFRDAVGATIYCGTSDMQRNIIAGLLGL
ncbi:MAG: acyl-CoA dehydrogenase family protein [Woeseiaceae bacterium]|nr:acyl-CoA dehydrogenase family protein [Woeseiaceae bacterium]